MRRNLTYQKPRLGRGKHAPRSSSADANGILHNVNAAVAYRAPPIPNWQAKLVTIVIGTCVLCGSTMTARLDQSHCVLVGMDRDKEALHQYALIHGDVVPNMRCGSANDVGKVTAGLQRVGLLEHVVTFA